jgi:PAS domain S-box-containing protein
MMKFLLLFLTIPALATYTYTVTMDDPEQAIFMLTNMIAAVAWVSFGSLIHMSRTRHSPPMVRQWIYPLAISMKIFAAISAVRYLLNNIVIYYPAAQPVQSTVFILNVLALGFAVGYASVYYKRVPKFLLRLNRHQAMSRRFTVIADTAVDGFLETDNLGNIWYANRAAAEILGARDSDGLPNPKQLLGRNVVDDFMTGGVQQQFNQLRAEFQATGKSEIIGRREPTKIEMKRVCGQLFCAEMTVSEYNVESEKRFCVILRDISYRVALEENQKELK